MGESLEVKRTFTPLGFSKGRLPDDVFASMREFYYNNRDPPHRLHKRNGIERECLSITGNRILIS
jgi:hypothetical protein